MKLDILKDLLYLIVGAIYKVHEELGPGLNEYVYQEALDLELKEEGLDFEREKTFHPIYRGKQLNATYRLDFIFLDLAIIECKAVEKLHAEHRAQLFNYMRITKLDRGVLLNFCERSLRAERYLYQSDSDSFILLTQDNYKLYIDD